MQFRGRYRNAGVVLAGALENEGSGHGRRHDGRRDLALDGAAETPHHPLRAQPALPAAMEVEQQAEIRHGQKQQKHYVSSTHGFDTTHG
jgi:hypothetical protein